MKITHCPPAYATGYAPSASDLEQLAEDTQKIRDGFIVLGVACKHGGDRADKIERYMARRAYQGEYAKNHD